MITSFPAGNLAACQQLTVGLLKLCQILSAGIQDTGKMVQISGKKTRSRLDPKAISQTVTPELSVLVLTQMWAMVLKRSMLGFTSTGSTTTCFERIWGIG